MKNIYTKYKHTVLASDIVVFTITDGELKVLLMKMKKAPYLNRWAVPGGLVQPNESVDAAADRMLRAKTGLSGLYLEQLYTFGRVDRDPFGRVVSTAYFALLSAADLAGKTAAGTEETKWFPANSLPKLAYDHEEIVSVAINRLQSKLTYTNIAYGLLPREFTLSELQKAYEIILDRRIDKRNFRKKIQALGLVAATNHRTVGTASRPALLYRFTSRWPKNINII